MAREETEKKLNEDSMKLLMKMNDVFMGQDMKAVFVALVRAMGHMTATSTEPKALEYAIEALKQSHERQSQRTKAN